MISTLTCNHKIVLDFSIIIIFYFTRKHMEISNYKINNPTSISQNNFQNECTAGGSNLYFICFPLLSVFDKKYLQSLIKQLMKRADI